MLGHELTHIRNGDVRMLVIAVIIAGAISFFAELVFRMMFQGGLRFGRGRREGGAAGVALLIAVALIAVAWVLSLVIRFALSRSRELLADAGSVELTKNPDAMISALRKIEGRGELAGATSAVMEMCVDNPREEFSDLFATHPPIEERIQAIIKFAGGHDPGPLALPSPGRDAPTGPSGRSLERYRRPDGAGGRRTAAPRRSCQAAPTRSARWRQSGRRRTRAVGAARADLNRIGGRGPRKRPGGRAGRTSDMRPRSGYG